MTGKSKHHKRSARDDRCQYTTLDGRRCRMSRLNDHPSLCFDHWQREQQLRDAERVANELLGSFDDFKTATAVNHALGKLFALLAKNRIPTRNAAVLAYISQLLLQSLPSVKKEVLLGRGSDAWEQAVCRALRNQVRRSVAGEMPRPLRQAAAPPDIPPEENSGVTG